MSQIDSLQMISRRDLVKGVAAFAGTVAANGAARALPSNRVLAYVGTYTGADGHGEGIYVFEMEPGTGALSNRRLVARTPSPSWIVIHPSRRFLYAVNEIDSFEGKSGSVSAFSIDGASGNLSPLNTVSSMGAGPAYISLDHAGRYAFVANYRGGTLAVLPIESTGALGQAVDVRRDEGSVGAAQAADAPPGSFAISGHDAPHVHMVLPDPRNRFVLATDLGQDRIYVYRFITETGKLSEHAQSTSLPSGDGPRHLAFHPNGQWLYSIQEEASTVALFDYDPESGGLHSRQTVSTLPPGFAGTSFASEILVHPGGKHLYAANRLHDTIAALSIGAEGKLDWRGETSTLGDYPVQCRIDPTGGFIYACNRHSDDITCFRIDPKTGLLRFTGRYTAAGSPGSITFLT